ncbi:uncharacterized protein METZ01_LOCUS428142, partial [marine metagenome]
IYMLSDYAMFCLNLAAKFCHEQYVAADGIISAQNSLK